MPMIEVELESANGPKVIVEGEHETDDILAELPVGWTVHDDDWNNGVELGPKRWAYPLTRS